MATDATHGSQGAASQQPAQPRRLAPRELAEQARETAKYLLQDARIIGTTDIRVYQSIADLAEIVADLADAVENLAPKR